MVERAVWLGPGRTYGASHERRESTLAEAQAARDANAERMRDARAIEMAKQNAQIASDYNFANSLNTSRLNLQQSEADAIAIAMQNLL